MRALVLDAGGALSLRDWPEPTTRDECLIRVSAAGICGTDLELPAHAWLVTLPTAPKQVCVADELVVGVWVSLLALAEIMWPLTTRR